jgi:hypothetical protein
MVSAKGKFKNIYAVKVQPNEDVLEELNRFCKENNVKHGAILTGLGSLREVSFFDPAEIPGKPGTYAYQDPIEWKEVTELVGVSGIICEDEGGSPSLHVHYTVADKNGTTFSGHMNTGNIVFATTDIIIGELEGIFMGRNIDPIFNLPLFYPRQL